MKITIETQTAAESRMVTKMVEVIENAKPVHVQAKDGIVDALLLHESDNGICVVSCDNGEKITIHTIAKEQVTEFSNMHVSDSSEYTYTPVTRESLNSLNRCREIGKSLYKICQDEHKGWYICETWNDGVGYAHGRSKSSDDLDEILFIFNHLDRENVFAPQ